MEYLLRPNPLRHPVNTYKRLEETTNSRGEKEERESREDSDITRTPGTKVTIMPLPDMSNLGGALATGLETEVENPYKDSANLPKKWYDYLHGRDMVKRQHILEYEHGVEPEFYTNQADITGRVKDPENLPFFQTNKASITMKDEPVRIDTRTPLGQLHYYMCVASSKVANDYEELSHEHEAYLTSLQRDSEQEASGKRKVNKVISKLETIYEAEQTPILGFCKVLLSDSTIVNLDTAYKELDRYIRDDRQGEKNRNQFTNLFELWNSPETRASFNARVFLADLVNSSIVFTKGVQYVWQPPKDSDGSEQEQITWESKDELLEFLLDDKYQPRHDEMTRQLNRAKGLE